MNEKVYPEIDDDGHEIDAGEIGWPVAEMGFQKLKAMNGLRGTSHQQDWRHSLRSRFNHSWLVDEQKHLKSQAAQLP